MVSHEQELNKSIECNIHFDQISRRIMLGLVKMIFSQINKTYLKILLGEKEYKVHLSG